MDHYANGRVRVESAGSEPGHELNPSIVAILHERGLDASKEFPKPLTDALARDANVVVTMGCGDACPFYPGTTYVDWELEDPAGMSIEEARPIVDEIDVRVRQLLYNLGVPV
jgi:protein-tyrosine-phosphatase